MLEQAWTMEALGDMPRYRSVPSSARVQAVGKLQIERCVDKHEYLMKRSPTMDSKVLLQWLVAGHFAGDRQSVTG